MTDEWRYKQDAPQVGVASLVGEKIIVENTKTGEERTLDVHIGQSRGDAIANGQFVDDDD